MTALRTALAALVLGAVAACAGCGDSLPVEQRAIVIAIGLDPLPQAGGTLMWTFVLPNVTATASAIGGIAPSQEVYDVRLAAPDLSTAIGSLQDHLSRQTYLGDLEVLALGLHTPTKQVMAVVSDLVQLGDVPDSYSIVATSDPTSRLLTLVSRQDVIPRYFLTTFLNCRDCHRFDHRILGWRFWAAFETPGDTPYTIVLAPQGSSGQVTSGIAVYRQLPGPALVMPPDATDGLGYLTGKAIRAVETGMIAGRRLSIVHISDSARSTARLRHGRVEVQVRLRVTGTLGSQGGMGDEEQLIRPAEAIVAHAVTHDVLTALRWANTEHCDPFGYTADALFAEPRKASALPPETRVWYPIDAHVTVHARVISAGTGQ